MVSKLNRLELDKHVQDAKAFFAKNDLNKVKQLLHPYAETQGVTPDVYFLLANVYHLEGNIAKAINTFRKALALDADNTDILISLAVLLNDIGKYSDAQKYFDMADSRVKKGQNGIVDQHINRKFSLQHFELAEMYATYQRFEESEREYRTSIGLDPENLLVPLKLALLPMKRGDHGAAIARLNDLKSRHPKYLQARLALAKLLHEEGKIILAQQEWQTVLEMDSNNDEAKMYLDLSKNSSETTLN
ncbi:MAG: tetratricopeptide repeat protein [Bacteriovoracaceae bacterium]|nr:tetratricopeptide repeat protein [Bacteriovoracaceae bacterium]